jgi:hypothetical protein
MFSRTKTLAVSIAMGAAVLFTPTSSVAAQTTVGDGLVNVAVGDVNIARNVDVGVAAEVAAQVCGLEVGPVNVLARQVDLSGPPVTVCDSDQGPVEITQ